MSRTILQSTAGDLEALISMYRGARFSDTTMERMGDIEINLFEKATKSPANDMADLTAKGVILKLAIRQELATIIEELAASLAADIERMAA
ncbi:hypothetical protein NO932_08610 [Pelagibacterium sp. 26DY04]|uniref:hypothetical protein n=1 Tax=Pelagibacterium sp. 26DY04 TaxID=2967130 RepID=UPI002814B180|nr:hypothetical protein [Pelagibacterium sp. 26DY04]WMT88650.1 hypothetical protein NO932_08610 [Pelagibacterium sp. 26DY04]